MASSNPISIPGLLGIVLGAAFVIGAFWNPFDQTFCSSGCGNFMQPLYDWLYAKFGHWGPRALMILFGIICIRVSWRRRWSAKTRREVYESTNKDAI